METNTKLRKPYERYAGQFEDDEKKRSERLAVASNVLCALLSQPRGEVSYEVGRGFEEQHMERLKNQVPRAIALADELIGKVK